ncbi:MAG TPA: murein biosynthesis integral membrane protein MurJ [Thermomicrobiales bacterium]|nr:murein biosynthesis integral membrane protein MurJ [Thermomicrobiales bacterium]
MTPRFWRRPQPSILRSGSARSLAGNAAIVAAAFAASRVLGLVREVVIASRFGTGHTYDAYVAAFRIPDLIFFIVMSGAFGSAFIPVFGGFLAKGDAERAWNLANTLLTWVVAGFAVVALLVSLLAKPLIGVVIAPELPAESQDLAVNLTRLLLLSPLLLGLSAAGKGMLEAQSAFILPAIAPILYNLGIIGGALLLTPVMGVYGLAAGVILGSLMHVALQFGSLLRNDLQLHPSFSPRTDGLAEVGRLMAPRILGQTVSQVNLIVMTNFASRLAEGSISALNYAQSLILLPHGILAMSLSTVIFPRMVQDHERGDKKAFRRTLSVGLRTLIFLTLPAAVGLLVYRTSIVQMLFQYGSFNEESTDMVATAVGFFSIGLIGRAVAEPVTRTFYAMRDTRTPVVVSILSVVVNIALSSALASSMGHAGLALSLSATYLLRMVILIIILSRRAGGLISELAPPVTRMLVPLAVFTAVALVAATPLARATNPADGRTLLAYVLFGLVLVCSMGLYLVTSWLLRLPEAIRLANTAKRRFRGFRD